MSKLFQNEDIYRETICAFDDYLGELVASGVTSPLLQRVEVLEAINLSIMDFFGMAEISSEQVRYVIDVVDRINLCFMGGIVSEN